MCDLESEGDIRVELLQTCLDTMLRGKRYYELICILPQHIEDGVI